MSCTVSRSKRRLRLTRNTTSIEARSALRGAFLMGLGLPQTAAGVGYTVAINLAPPKSTTQYPPLDLAPTEKGSPLATPIQLLPPSGLPAGMNAGHSPTRSMFNDLLDAFNAYSLPLPIDYEHQSLTAIDKPNLPRRQAGLTAFATTSRASGTYGTSDLTGLFRSIAATLEQNIQARFDTKTDPDGVRWPARAPSTAKQRARQGHSQPENLMHPITPTFETASIRTPSQPSQP
ncbi:phage virion morphogenesis protein [Paraburkholderia sp. UCT70]|uniref:phage virion morphogenesis protein n=1 Tax=Paraburkholderia sp. UCT70 TaxID=2991068 RepID=UPI003D262E12